MTKVAILQVADTGPLESLVVMLRSAGYECYLPNTHLRMELRQAVGDEGLVLDIDSLVRGMGYDWPMELPQAGVDMLGRCDLYADVKAHRCYHRLAKRWPRLKNRVLWYRINGGRPEHVVNARGDHGDEVNPPCPVLTPNQWYREPEGLPQPGDPWPGWAGRAYTCWPPFYRFDAYARCDDISNIPVCLIHNLQGWGYGALVDDLRSLGVRCYGAGSPDGLIRHQAVPPLLAKALCMVHLKSSDAPGYALYEALAAGCPVVCTRRLIWRCRMQDLLIPGETCLVFDRETHDGLTEADVAECAREVAGHLERLRDPAENRRIGEAGRARLRDVMWSAERQADVDSLREWLGRVFP